MIVTTLQLNATKDYDKNLQNLIAKYKNSNCDFVAAPEVSLTGFDYDNFEKAAAFGEQAKQDLLKMVGNTPLLITLIEKREHGFYNTAYLFHNGQIVHSQSKHKLFLLGNEEKYFLSGNEEEIKKFELDGVTCGILICFELRFTHLWKKVEGADIIFIPAAWGNLRKSHLEKLSTALAIANRCFVVVSDLSNSDMAKSSGIITPFGEFYKDDRKSVITKKIDLKEIKKIKRFIPY